MINILEEQIFQETIEDIYFTNNNELIDNLNSCIVSENFENISEFYLERFLENFLLFELIKPKEKLSKRTYLDAIRRNKQNIRSVSPKNAKNINVKRSSKDLLVRKQLNSALRKGYSKKDLIGKIKEKSEELSKRIDKSKFMRKSKVFKPIKHGLENTIKGALAVKRTINRNLRKGKAEELKQEKQKHLQKAHQLHKLLKTNKNLNFDQKKKLRKQLQTRLERAKLVSDKYKRKFGK